MLIFSAAMRLKNVIIFAFGEEYQKQIKRGRKIVAENSKRVSAECVGKRIAYAVFSPPLHPSGTQKVKILKLGVIGCKRSRTERRYIIYIIKRKNTDKCYKKCKNPLPHICYF